MNSLSGPWPQPRGTIASVTKYIPFEGIGHAGGEYLQNHYRVLSSTWNVLPIAPDTELNRRAARADRTAPHTLVTSKSPLAHTGLKPLADLQSAARGSSVHRWFEQALVRDQSLLDVFRNAQLIEFQWSETASLTAPLRQIAPQVPQVVIAHDVITQRWRRASEQASSLVRQRAFKAAAHASLRRESRSFATADAVIVFSEKDAALVRELAPTAHPEVVHPGFAVPPAAERPPAERPPIVLFTGAMGRPDNDSAIRWFIEHSWPMICDAVPQARLVIAGSNPTPALTRLAASKRSVTLTGYVESLEPYFQQARVAVVPIQTGAGVKFKTIDAMMRGVPVVSTSVGAEGIDRPDLMCAITDDPKEIARATVAQLRDPDSARTTQAQAWAIATYGNNTFQTRLTNLYSELIGSSVRRATNE